MKTKSGIINVNDLKAFMDLIEAEHELSFHLQKFLDANKEKLVQLENIKNKAKKINILKTKFNSVKHLYQRVAKEDRIKINNMFRLEGIRI